MFPLCVQLFSRNHHCSIFSVGPCQGLFWDGHAWCGLMQGLSLSPMPGNTFVSPQASGPGLWEPRYPAALGLSVIVPCLFQERSPGPVCCRGRGPRPLWVSMLRRWQLHNLLSWLSSLSSSSNFRAFHQSPFGLLPGGWEIAATFCSAMVRAVQEGSECWGGAEEAQWAAPLLFSGPTFPFGRQQLSLGWKNTQGLSSTGGRAHSGLQGLRAFRALQSLPHLIRGGSDPHYSGIILVKFPTKLLQPELCTVFPECF